MSRYCLKNKTLCEYTNPNIENPICDYEKSMGKIHSTCGHSTQDFKRIIQEVFSDRDFEEFGKELLIYENNKYMRKMVKQMFDVCCEGIEQDSGMEYIQMIFFKEYALKKIRENKKREDI